MDQQTTENEDFCLKIITMANQARQGYLQAIQLAKKGDTKAALSKISEADKAFNSAHDVHIELLQAEADKETSCNLDLLLVHAEDIMMNAEIIKILALELNEVYAKISNQDTDFSAAEADVNKLCSNTAFENKTAASQAAAPNTEKTN